MRLAITITALLLLFGFQKMHMPKTIQNNFQAVSSKLLMAIPSISLLRRIQY